MLTRGLASVRVRLVLLVLLAVLPALGLTLRTATEQRRLAAEAAQSDARLQAASAAADQADQVVAARPLLKLLARLPAIQAGDVAACDALLARLLPQYPAYTNLTVLRPAGDVVCSAPPASPGLDLSDRAYLQRALSTREFAAGDFIVGRISGQPSIDFAYPVVDADGTVRQVLALGIDLTWLNRYLVAADWPADKSLTIFDQSGTIVASYPAADRTGRARGDRPLIQTVLAQREGVAR